MSHETAVVADARAIADHLRTLYGADGGDAPGYAVAFTLPDGEVLARAGDSLFGEWPTELAERAANSDVYLSVALQRHAPSSGRGTAADVHAVPGVWIDLDVAGPNHKSTDLPKTLAEALDFIASLPFEPSLIIYTGGGLHVYYLFRELVLCETDAERDALASLSRAFQRAVIARGTTRGWRLDDTSDLARILRPAGTINHKHGQRQLVRTMFRGDARYAPSDFGSFAVSAPPATIASPSAPLHTRGETVNAIVGGWKASGMSSGDIADALDRRIRRYIETIGARGEGDRDNTAYRLARWLLSDFGVSEAVALAYMQEWNAGNTPPLTERDLRAKLYSARRSGRRAPGCAHARRGSAA